MAVNSGRPPFPWQERLAAQVSGDRWPSEIGVPTGLGKTSCIDIAVWALARQGLVDPTVRVAPTRIWYVVNRRLLVDAAYERGLRLQQLLADPETLLADDPDTNVQAIEAIADVANALGRLVATPLVSGPLHVTRLRGGAEVGARPPDSAQPTLVFATVPMFASRWLFRGYGTSQSMRPVDAALAGTDSLILLDEAHLARPLMALAGPLADCDIGDPGLVLPTRRARPVFVAMTATGEGGPDRFDLGAEDLANPIVKKRLEAAKPIRLIETTKVQLGAALSSEAVQMLSDATAPASCLVFANTPREARSVADKISKLASKQHLKTDVLVVTGRLRDREADAYRKRLLDPLTGAPSDRDRIRPRARHLIVVATQTLEVGADLDFDLLVTESAGTRAVTQRLGRLNRLGLTPGAVGAICHPVDRKPDEPIYGNEPDEFWTRLQAIAVDGLVHLNPSNIAKLVGPPTDVPNRVGELLPAHLWEWAKTSCPPIGEAPAELFYGGFDDNLARVSVCWRSVVPAPGSELLRPVSDYESVELPLHEVRDAFKAWDKDDIWRLAPDRTAVEVVKVDRLRPGDQIILDCSEGGYDEFGWSPGARSRVLDVSLIRPGREYLPLLPSSVGNLLDIGTGGSQVAEGMTLLTGPPADDEVGRDPQADRELAQRIIGLLRTQPRNAALTDAEFENFWHALDPDVVRVQDAQGGERAFLAARPTGGFVRVEIRADAFDALSFVAQDAALAAHLGTVGQHAEKIGKQLGLSDHCVEAVRVAGEFHDLGKLDPRFQRWLDPGNRSPVPLAKSRQRLSDFERYRVAAGWPRGGRHELISGLILQERIDSEPRVTWDTDLVLHLVMSHHGHARPTLLGVPDGAPPDVAADVDGLAVTTRADLSKLDWSQPARFRRLCERYGYWGVALLEAVVRQADHVASQANEVI